MEPISLRLSLKQPESVQIGVDLKQPDGVQGI